MALPTNALTAPLGQRRLPPEAKPAKLRSALPALVIGGLSIVLLAFAAYATLADDPLGGEPIARVAAKTKPVATLAASVQPETSTPPVMAAAPTSAPRQTIGIINGATGQRQEVEIGGTLAPQRTAPAEDGGTRIDISPTGSVKITPADGKQAAEIKRYMQSAQKPPGSRVINIPQ